MIQEGSKNFKIWKSENQTNFKGETFKATSSWMIFYFLIKFLSKTLSFIQFFLLLNTKNWCFKESYKFWLLQYEKNSQTNNDGVFWWSPHLCKSNYSSLRPLLLVSNLNYCNRRFGTDSHRMNFGLLYSFFVAKTSRLIASSPWSKFLEL